MSNLHQIARNGQTPITNPLIPKIHTMKNYLLLFIGVILIAGIACQETVDVKKEKEAIIAVIKAEKDAYNNEDMESLMIHNLQDSSYFFMYASKDNFYANRGYADQAGSIKEQWENRNPDVTWEFEFKVVELKIFPQSAWAVIKGKMKITAEEWTWEPKMIETLFLEKIEAEWKISGQTVINASSYVEEEGEKEDEGDEDDDDESENTE